MNSFHYELILNKAEENSNDALVTDCSMFLGSESIRAVEHSTLNIEVSSMQSKK